MFRFCPHPFAINLLFPLYARKCRAESKSGSKVREDSKLTRAFFPSTATSRRARSVNTLENPSLPRLSPLPPSLLLLKPVSLNFTSFRARKLMFLDCFAAEATATGYEVTDKQPTETTPVVAATEPTPSATAQPQVVEPTPSSTTPATTEKPVVAATPVAAAKPQQKKKGGLFSCCGKSENYDQ